MKFIRPLSAAVAAAICASSIGIVAFAEEDAAMKKELTYVKQRVTIPEELSEFNYTTHKNSRGNTTYYFNWNTPPDAQEYKIMSVSICGKVITSYNKYDDKIYSGESEYSFGKLSKEELLKKAKEWIKKLNPTVSKYISPDEDSIRVMLGSNNAYINVCRMQNGIPVNGQRGSITVNKDTGELISYNLDWIFGAGFSDPKDAVSVETAIGGFKEEFPLELYYTAEYDWQEKEYTPHLIYQRTKGGEIDAFTGKLATFEESYNYFDTDDLEEECADDADAETENPATGAAVSFTDNEIEKMEDEAKLVKAEDALKALKKSGIYNLPENAELTYSHTNFNEQLGAYITNFNFSAENKGYEQIDEGGYYPLGDDVVEDVEDVEIYFSGSCRINAETGEVLNYSGSGSTSEDTALKSEDKAKKLLEKYLGKIAGKKANEFRIDSVDYAYSNYDKNGNPEKDSDLVYAGAYSQRYVNEIRCQPENVSINIDQSGKVSSYNINYYGIKYPSPKKAITAEKAYDSYFEQVDYSLLYRAAQHNKKVETALVYRADEEFYIDAFSGKLTYSSGAEIVKETASGYTDLENSKYKEIAEKLAVYGITLMDEEGRLNEDKAITRDDFRSLISNVGVYCDMEEKGTAELTRQYAAKLLASRYISEEVAELQGIFKSPFSDVKETSKYVGYIAVANAKGLMTGENGKFRPNDKITRGEALVMIYDILA